MPSNLHSPQNYLLDKDIEKAKNHRLISLTINNDPEKGLSWFATIYNLYQLYWFKNQVNTGMPWDFKKYDREKWRIY